MKQRVAIARVLANNANILLMDEPFARSMRSRASSCNTSYCRSGRAPASHRLRHAFGGGSALLADRVLVMSAGPGRIESDIGIDLPRPRDVSSPEFNAVRRDWRGGSPAI